MSAVSLWTATDPRLAPSPRLDDVVALLRDHAGGADAEQRATRQTMLAFASDHDDALVRACAPGHFTGSALVVDAAGERTLVLFHRKLQRWLQPGGHADGDGNLPAVALREATEETGIPGLLVDPVPIDLDIHEVAPPGEPVHLHLDVRFLVVAPPGAVEQGNHESEALRWVRPDALVDLGVDPGTRRLARAGFARMASHR
jgi:8-oxo-dGTP pyrophosphatase MutT (NUDIX family)